MKDSFQITQNADGSYTATWDKEDPNWSFLNNFTAKELQIIIEQAVKEDTLKTDHKKSYGGT